MITIDIQDFVPAGKQRPRFSSAGKFVRVHTPAATQKYEATIRLFAQQAMGTLAPLAGPLVMRVTARMPIPKSWRRRQIERAKSGQHRPTTKPDADNILKSAQDACNGVVFGDDSQIVTALVSKYYADKPSLRIEVEQVAA